MPRAAMIGSSVSGTIRMPSFFSIQRMDVAGLMPYFSRILLGMTIWPFEVTFDIAFRIVPILLAMPGVFVFKQESNTQSKKLSSFLSYYLFRQDLETKRTS
jgi:hypothetical protein